VRVRRAAPGYPAPFAFAFALRPPCRLTAMTDPQPTPSLGPTPTPQAVTQVLAAMAGGDRLASDRLLPMVYDELRRLARQHMARESAGQTLQATALVHEAYMRLIGPDGGESLKWDSRGHFFASAAIAMRRILVERARSRGRIKRGGGAAREQLHDETSAQETSPDSGRNSGPDSGQGSAQGSGQGSGPIDLCELDDVLVKFEKHDARRYQVVMLRYFAGLSVEQTALAMGLSATTVKSDWSYAKAWLHREMAALDREP